ENGGEVGTICRDYCVNGNRIMRATGDRMLLSPPLVISKPQSDEIVEKAKRAIDATAKQWGFAGCGVGGAAALSGSLFV
ncbi:hypothetical protein AAHH80_38895, partial [Burkholderia pseudomallei]